MSARSLLGLALLALLAPSAHAYEEVSGGAGPVAERFFARWPDCAKKESKELRAGIDEALGAHLAPDESALLVVTRAESLWKAQLGSIHGAAIAVVVEGRGCRQWAVSLPHCRTSFSVQWELQPGVLWIVAPIHVNSVVARLDLKRRRALVRLAEQFAESPDGQHLVYFDGCTYVKPLPPGTTCEHKQDLRVDERVVMTPRPGTALAVERWTQPDRIDLCKQEPGEKQPQPVSMVRSGPNWSLQPGQHHCEPMQAGEDSP